VHVVILETHAFTARIVELLSDDEYRLLQQVLVARPDAGRLIRGTGGLRKLRWAAKGRGKRGGARIVYYWHVPGDRLLMLLSYKKGEQDDLTPRQRAVLRKIVEMEYP
jgi:mRNA-degrading endonuclease RelE of RelBE toxin-antitoxin system